MNTLMKILSTLFLMIAIFAVIGALFGASHQWGMFFISLIMSIAVNPKSKKTII